MLFMLTLSVMSMLAPDAISLLTISQWPHSDAGVVKVADSAHSWRPHTSRYGTTASTMDQTAGVEQPKPEDSSGRWEHLQKLLCRGSPLAHPDFEPSEEV